jgi:hypothetical protein
MERKYSIELFRDGGEGAGIEKILVRHDSLTAARVLYKAVVLNYVISGIVSGRSLRANTRALSQSIIKRSAEMQPLPPEAADYDPPRLIDGLSVGASATIATPFGRYREPLRLPTRVTVGSKAILPANQTM